MESLTTGIDMMTLNFHMDSIDIASAYYQVSIAQRHQKWLKFEWHGKLYKFVP